MKGLLIIRKGTEKQVKKKLAYRVPNSNMTRRRLGQSVPHFFLSKKKKKKKKKKKRLMPSSITAIVDAEIKILLPKNQIKAIKGGLFSLTQSINIFIATCQVKYTHT